MSKLIAKHTVIGRKIEDVFNWLERCYRHSHLRNAILAIKGRNGANRFASSNNRFVIFLVPGMNIVNGGIMSICSIASETEKLLARNGVSVAVCTAYGEPRLLRYTRFDNNADILAFSDLLPRFPSGANVLVHVPELFVQKFVSNSAFVYQRRPDIKWRFNILLQNVDLMPSKEAVDVAQQIGFTTVTINHGASADLAQSLGCAVHYLSWGLWPDQFERVKYSDKKKLIVISPDQHFAKEEIVRRMSEALPDHKIVEIQNMTYQQYKCVIKQAKFTFTFGEGLDGYFVESIFSGAIGMAIYNERFFTEDYVHLDGVFQDSFQAVTGVGDFLRRTDEESNYQITAIRQHELVSRTFVREGYLENIRGFYERYHLDWISPQLYDDRNRTRVRPLDDEKSNN